MKTKIFKCRASAIHNITGSARSKSESLSQTAKSYCELWLKQELFGRTKQIQSKYLKKGIVNESESLKLINAAYNTSYQKYAGERFENDYFSGMPDIFTTHEIIDIKNAYDFDTMPTFMDEPDAKYLQQVQIYLNLSGASKGSVIHTLTNMPLDMVEADAWKLAKYENIEFEEAYAICLEMYDYFDVPENLKLKRFDFAYDENFIKLAESKVLECRDYINFLIKKI